MYIWDIRPAHGRAVGQGPGLPELPRRRSLSHGLYVRIPDLSRRAESGECRRVHGRLLASHASSDAETTAEAFERHAAILRDCAVFVALLKTNYRPAPKRS